MGAIAAALTESTQESEPLVIAMLRALRHRGTNLEAVTFENGPGRSIGSASRDHDTQLFESKDSAAVLHGSIFDGRAKTTFTPLLHGSTVVEGSRSCLEEPGFFSVMFCRGKRLFAFRDLNGMKPLYFARRRKIEAFASERKALWRIGMTNVQRINPGHLYSVSNHRLSESKLARLPRPTESKMTLNQASSRLSKLLTRSVQRITRRVPKIAVAFSGGIDSALTAFLARRLNSSVEAVSVGLQNSPELPAAERIARQIDLPITLRTFDTDSLESYVRRVVWLIEEPNLMKVSIAVPLHWAAMLAEKRGCSVMLCGQGSDELYGGYYKYARTLDGKGRRALATELYESVLNAAEVNYERDDQATSPFGIELRTPFADLDLIRFSLTIPSEFKVRAGNDLTRKWILRTAAKKAGLPEDIVWRRKKAIQHGTGVEKAIRKLAKSRGMTTDAYLSKVHQEVIGMDSIP